MTTTDFFKQAYCETLLSLCNKKTLCRITVTDVVANTGTARQTFYSRFRDINDLISYIPINFMETCGKAELDSKVVQRKAYWYAFEHKSFFCQLPFHNSQNSFRDSFLAYHIKINSRNCKLDESDEKYLNKQLLIYHYCAGGIDLFLEWCRRGMDWPIEILAETIEMIPAPTGCSPLWR